MSFVLTSSFPEIIIQSDCFTLLLRTILSQITASDDFKPTTPAVSFRLVGVPVIRPSNNPIASSYPIALPQPFSQRFEGNFTRGAKHTGSYHSLVARDVHRIACVYAPCQKKLRTIAWTGSNAFGARLFCSLDTGEPLRIVVVDSRCRCALAYRPSSSRF